MKPADAATLSGAFIGSISLAVALEGDVDLAVRTLFLAYAMDVVDGYIARKQGSTQEGFMLDRAVDRFTQVIAPSILLLIAVRDTSTYPLYALYASMLVTLALYRLVYRRVSSLAFFSGLPLLSHSLIILTSLMAHKIPNLVILYYILILSITPVKYYRRPNKRGRQAGFTLARLTGVLLLAVLPYGGLLSKLVYYLVVASVILYSVVGAALVYGEQLD